MEGVIKMFNNLASPKSTTPHIVFQQLGFQLSNGFTILHPLSGDIEAGDMVGIMGTSGSGKSTFMNRLNGRIKGGKKLGEVLCNGTPYLHLGHLCPGFVPQADIMHPDL